MNKLKTDKKLFNLILLYIPLSIFFIICFSLLMVFPHDILKKRISIVFWLFFSLWVINYIFIFIYSMKNKQGLEDTTVSEEVLEKKMMSYNLSMAIGWIAFPIFYVWYAYHASGAKAETMIRVIRDYHISQMNEIIERESVVEQIDKNPELEQKINDVKHLYKTSFISFEEYITYLWEILESNEIEYVMEYDDDAVEKMAEIIDTY